MSHPPPILLPNTHRPTPSRTPRQIHLPYVQTGFYPTQHLNLRLLSHDRFNMFQSHPLTITTSASGSGSGPDGSRSGLTLYAKSVGGWTGRLNNLATASTRNKPYGSRSTEILFIPGRGRVDATPVQVILDGPYGGLDVELDLMRYEEVLMVAGGSGITFVLGAMEGVLDGFRRTSREGEKRGSGSGSRKLRSISVVWSVRDPSKQPQPHHHPNLPPTARKPVHPKLILKRPRCLFVCSRHGHRSHTYPRRSPSKADNHTWFGNEVHHPSDLQSDRLRRRQTRRKRTISSRTGQIDP